MQTRLAVALVTALCVSGCSYRPPRFADRTAVLEVKDDAPIAVPRPRQETHAVDLWEEYLRNLLVGGMDPSRTREAEDVNALDEVPRSSWFPGGPPLPEGPVARGYEGDGRPVLPLHLGRVAATTEGGIVVEDARGLLFELFRDPPDRPEMITAAAAIASRLVRAVGYATPEVWVVHLPAPSLLAAPHRDDAEGKGTIRAFLAAGPKPVEGRYRVGALRWPIGIDLGPPPPVAQRVDDPNDRITHENRRVLRALPVVGAWLDLHRVSERLLRDAYVGKPGEGSVIHFITGLDGALGADDVVRLGDKPSDLQVEGDPVNQLLSLGLWTAPPPRPTQSVWPAIGAIRPAAARADGHSAPPLEPGRIALPGDAYWVAKRIARIPSEAIERSIAAGEITDSGAVEHLTHVIAARRRDVVARAYHAVTPCEPVRVDTRSLVLRDEAIAFDIKESLVTSYRVRFLDDDGDPVVADMTLEPKGAEVEIPLAPEVIAEGYAVVRVLALRASVAAPRWMEVHLRTSAAGIVIAGVRH